MQWQKRYLRNNGFGKKKIMTHTRWWRRSQKFPSWYLALRFGKNHFLPLSEPFFGVLDQGWCAQAYGEGRRWLPKMEIATCVGRKGKQEKRMKAKRCLCKSWTSCYHQEEPKAPSRKRSSYAWICHCSSCFRIKEMGKGKDNYFLVEKHYMTKKTKVTLPHSIVFTFSHFLTAILGQ